MKFCFVDVLRYTFAVFVAPVLTQNTINDIINARGELSMIKNLLQGTVALEKLRSSASRLTFFAAHNSAFGNINEQLRSQLNGMSRDVANQIFLYHTANGLTRTSNLTLTPELRLQSLASNGPLNLFLYKEGTAYVNGAGFIEADIVTTNGVLHIIDSFFVQLGPTVTAFAANIDSYVTKQEQSTRAQERTTEFSNLLQLYDEFWSKRMLVSGIYGSLLDDVLKASNAFVTAFIPSDDAIVKFRTSSPEKFKDLTREGTPAILQRVLESHAIPNGAYHSSLLIALTSNATTVPAMQGSIRMYSYDGELYVSNNCVRAKVTKANTTANNGVVYIIDNVIGYIINDLYMQIQRDNGITEFRGTIVAAPSSFQAILQLPAGKDDVPDEQKLTVFAPTDYAYNNVFQNDFSQETTEKLEQLNMHLLRGMLQVDQMANGLKRETLSLGKFAKFYQLPDGVYVEVDYVRGKIVEADICTKNGIIHKVDSILGVPSRTIFREIANNPQLTFLETVSINTGLQTLLQDTSRQLTMFAPTDDAFGTMSTESPSYLNRQNESKLRNILYRHIGRGALFLDQIVAINSETTINTYNGEIRIGNQNNEYYILIGSRRVRVIQANMRMQNGVIHIVDKVIYDPNDPRTGESISGSNVLVPSSLLLIATSVQRFHL